MKSMNRALLSVCVVLSFAAQGQSSVALARTRRPPPVVDPTAADTAALTDYLTNLSYPVDRRPGYGAAYAADSVNFADANAVVAEENLRIARLGGNVDLQGFAFQTKWATDCFAKSGCLAYSSGDLGAQLAKLSQETGTASSLGGLESPAVPSLDDAVAKFLQYCYTNVEKECFFPTP